MTIYARIVAMIIATSFVIIIFGVVVGAYFLTRHMSDAIEEDMTIVVDIADKYIASEIKLLKIHSAEAAQKVGLSYDAGKREYALERVCADYPEFIGLAVFDGTTMLDSWGESPVSPDLGNAPFMGIAKAGGQAISTTMHSQDGTLVMYVSAPMEDGLVLAAVLPGQHFSELLSQFVVYQSGHLFVDDAEGHVIVNIRPEWVEKRMNFIEMAKEDDRYRELGAIIQRGISGERGTARYTLDGIPRIYAFRPVSSENEGWFVGLAAPLPESPLKEIPRGMVIIGAITLVLSMLAALVAANLLKRPYEELERLKETAVTASMAKSSFLAMMSHEIRTPLNAVVGLSELMIGEDDLPQDAESNLEKINNAGTTILSIVNNILDISKIESGKFEFYPIQYDTPSLINDIVTLNTMRIGEKPITFKLYVDENLPCALCGDDLRIKQIFNNLLSNAFKYTNSGTVEWLISFERAGNCVWLVSSIRDTGIGIKPDDVLRLFGEYSQADPKTTRGTEGTGLGLAITKRLVEWMGGTIAVESEYGKGTEFHVRLRQQFVSDTPIGKDVAGALISMRHTFSKRVRNKQLTYMNLSYAHVLVVDDIVTNLDVVKGMLKPYKIKIDCAVSGMLAIEMIRAENPRYNAVFMDHMMPGMDGVEATRIIREEIGTEYARNVPIIALTANAIAGNEEMFSRHGFQAFISKPIDVLKLDSVLRLWIRDKNLENGIFGMEEEPHCSVDQNCTLDANPPLLAGVTIQGVDKDMGVERFGGNEATFIAVLRSYAANTPPLLAELRKHLTAENLRDYAVVVHGIKGASYGIFAQEVGNAAKVLEIAAKKGDLGAVENGHGIFENTTNSLLNNLNKALVDIETAENTDKPVAATPDPQLLTELREACGVFDMDKIDRLMARLESFRYENGGNLVVWLHDHVSAMMLAEIARGEWPSE